MCNPVDARGKSGCGWALAAALLVGGLSLPFIAAAASAQDDPNARDLVRLTSWFEGSFDNQEQIWFETEGRAKVPPAERHERMHATHRRISLPAFGTHVFYVEEYLDDEPGKVFRQRLVTFDSAREQGIRMQLWFFKDPKSVLGSQDDSARLSGLTAEQVTRLPECDVFWHAQADHYVGSMREKACVLGQGAQKRFSQHDLLLSATKYWRIDRTFNLATNALMVGNPSGVPHRLNRAKRFDCAVNFYSGGYLKGPSPEDQAFKGKQIHSQGGTIKLTRKSDGKTYALRLRDKEYPYYESRSDFMFLSVREGDGPFIGYSLHDPDARFLGFNLGWMSVTCERFEPPQ